MIIAMTEDIIYITEESDVASREEGAEVLLEAAELIEQCGWVRGWYELAGSYCMDGAIQEVIEKRAIQPFRIDSLYCSARLLLSEIGIPDVSDYNDETAESLQEAVGTLRRAASNA
jgi:hypothetical protein